MGVAVTRKVTNSVPTPEPYIFTPSDLAELAGISGTVQRDWRRRGILPSKSVPGICKRSAKGRWTFTFEGYQRLWILNRLAKFGFDLCDATHLAGVLVDDMHKFMQRDTGGSEDGDVYCRYTLIFPSEQGRFRPRSKFHRTNDPLQDMGDAPAVFTTVDVEELSYEFARSLCALAKHKVDEIRSWVLEVDPSAQTILDQLDQHSLSPSAVPLAEDD